MGPVIPLSGPPCPASTTTSRRVDGLIGTETRGGSGAVLDDSAGTLAGARATDVDENPVFLAANQYNLQAAMERWPSVGFHATREHGERLTHR